MDSSALSGTAALDWPELPSYEMRQRYGLAGMGHQLALHDDGGVTP
jgi:hypothetical protein